MSCGVGHRHSSDLALLWLWHKPAAVALIRPLAWEPPHVIGAALRQKTKDRKKKKLQQLYQQNTMETERAELILSGIYGTA